jgi:hypothetical protein
VNGAITDSVGKGGKNQRHDVLVVQMLLNNHSATGSRSKLSVDGVCGPLTEEAILAYQHHAVQMVHPDGVVFPSGRTLRSLLEVATVKHKQLVRQVHVEQKLQSPSIAPVANVDQVAPLPKPVASGLKAPDTHVATGKKPGHKYTDSPLELPKTGTEVNPLQLPALFKKAWTDLNDDGARLIAAQYMGETTGGKHCWNYNLGNVKCTSAQRKTHLHQYFPGTWEYYSAEKAASEVKTNSNARYATAAEIKAKVGKESGGKKVVFYLPPDISTCFLAYNTLADGVVDFMDRWKHMAKRYPTLLATLNKGDAAGSAKILHQAKYFTADESKYAKSMKTNKEYLDKVLAKK